MNIPEIGDLEGLDVLFTLLPGLITYLLVNALTDRGRKIEAVEAVLHGLAYTLVVHAIWFLLQGIDAAAPIPDLVGLCLTSIVLALVVAWLINSGRVYRVLRRIRLTNEPSWTTVWHTAFVEFRLRRDSDLAGEYVVLHLKDHRRVMGAVRGSSREQKGGHICLQRVRWLEVSGSAGSERAGFHLFNAEDIRVVEFLPLRKGVDNAKRRGVSTTAATGN